ncbi:MULTISPECIES: GerAB/ArcD/ProY family transporter [Cohnella]|uniref:GerAB/ArcD/ProY family transporter n=1 Tax=Cohnella TaxID=329857 RepID=UPI0009BAD3C4|nr:MULTISPECIES: endospore germination permease [Cohnella]MBN2984177.1 endospore germination permease [Cohnella algarum]
MNPKKINGYQFFFIIFVSITSLTFFSVPSQLADKVGQDLWLSMAIGTLIDVYVAFLLYRLGMKYPGESMIEYTVSILGPIGKTVGLLFILFFTGVSITAIWIYSEFLSNTLLPNTPLVVFSLTLTLCSGWAAFKGIETIARISQLIGFVILASSLVLFASSIPLLQLKNLLPQFEYGAGPALRGAVYPGSWFGICIMMGMLMPHLNKPEKTFKMKVRAVVLGAVVMTLYLLYSISVMGPDMATRVENPIYIFTRLTHFIIFERIEVLTLLIFVSGSFITFSTLYYSIAEGCAKLFGTRRHAGWIYAFSPLFVGCVFFPFMFSHGFMEPYLEFWFPRVALALEGGVTTLLFLLSFFRPSDGKRHAGT